MSTKDTAKMPLLTLYTNGEGNNGYEIALNKTTLNHELPALTFTHYKIENAASANLITFSYSPEIKVNGVEILIIKPLQSKGHDAGTFQLRVVENDTTTAICPLSAIFDVTAGKEIVARGIRVMKCERARTDDANQPRMVSVVY